MKERFLALVEEVKQAGIVEALQKTSTAEEMSAEWNKFLDENQDLCTRIRDWANEFKGLIFEEDEELENPLEIVAVIHIIKDEYVSEVQIFEDWDKLVDAVRGINNDFAIAVADCIDVEYIHLITAEAIFSAYEN